MSMSLLIRGINRSHNYSTTHSASAAASTTYGTLTAIHSCAQLASTIDPIIGRMMLLYYR